MSRKNLPLFIVIIALICDQVFKIWIKTSMSLGEEIHIFGDWFILHFTENNGMAFGMEFAGNWGKLILSIFRIVAIGGLIWYLVHLQKTKAHKGYIISISFILAGAIGNIIDSAFYGIIFSESSYAQVATIFPEGGGYSKFLYGEVVDMLYFPVINGNFPDWFPFVGSKPFIFFRPVFNIADSCITTGVFMILFFQKRFFRKNEN
ncbi:lipoprotein signal peptidase [Bacteroidota bacterium]